MACICLVSNKLFSCWTVVSSSLSGSFSCVAVFGNWPVAGWYLALTLGAGGGGPFRSIGMGQRGWGRGGDNGRREGLEA